MKARNYRELLASVRKGGAVLRGEKPAARRYTVEAEGARDADDVRVSEIAWTKTRLFADLAKKA